MHIIDTKNTGEKEGKNGVRGEEKYFRAWKNRLTCTEGHQPHFKEEAGAAPQNNSIRGFKRVKICVTAI